MEVIHHSDTIWTIPHFLQARECEDLILFSERKGYEEATLGLRSGAKMIKGIRNNYRLGYEDQKLAQNYWARLSPYCPKQLGESWSVGLNERFRFYRYESNQRFKRHIDGRLKGALNEESRITFMVYLNDNFKGGETRFDQFSITPQRGMALCFVHEQKHEGCPVEEGSKYVLRSDVMYRRAP